MGFNRRKMEDERRHEANEIFTVCDDDHFETQPAGVTILWVGVQTPRRRRSIWLEQ
jgi:hypothetical protein